MPKWVTIDSLKDSRDPKDELGTRSPMVTYEENPQTFLPIRQAGHKRGQARVMTYGAYGRKRVSHSLA